MGILSVGDQKYPMEEMEEYDSDQIEDFIAQFNKGGCGVVWFGVVWCGVVWCGVVWCGVVWCGVVWCGVMWYGVVL